MINSKRSILQQSIRYSSDALNDNAIYYYFMIILIVITFFPALSIAHGTDKHTSVESDQIVEKAVKQESEVGNTTSVSEINNAPQSSTASAILVVNQSEEFSFSDLSLSNFPTNHPIIVHVPVIFIPLALVMFLVSLLRSNSEYRLMCAIFISIGAIGGFIAAFPLHPHTIGLTPDATITLKKHDYFAYITLSLATLASIFCWSTLFRYRKNRLLTVILSVLLLSSSISVAITAHFGGTLSYKHGIGVQGNYLSH